MLLTLAQLDGYRAMFSGAVGGTDNVADTAIKAMPLLLVGVGSVWRFAPVSSSAARVRSSPERLSQRSLRRGPGTPR